jgi:hypothetical protein
MKVIIAGSRTIEGEDAYIDLLVAVNQALKDWGLHSLTEIVTGGARGVDAMGKEFAREFGIAHKEFPADWDTHGTSAGYKRNAQMADYADALLLLWDGKSKGSAMMKDIAQKKGMLVQERIV